MSYNDLPPTETPWGHRQSLKEIVVGICSMSTSSHGGYWVSDSRLAEMPECLKYSSDFYRDERNWFEEDCEWARVACAFPQLFPPYHRFCALRSLKSWNPEPYAAFMQTDQGKALQAECDEYAKANANMLECGCIAGGGDIEGTAFSAWTVDGSKRYAWNDMGDYWPKWPISIEAIQAVPTTKNFREIKA